MYIIIALQLYKYIYIGKVYGQSDFKYVILKYFYLKFFNFVKF